MWNERCVQKASVKSTGIRDTLVENTPSLETRALFAGTKADEEV